MIVKLLSADRLRYVTSRYPQLQGARLIPLSLVFLASAWWRAGGIHLPGDHLTYGARAWFFGGVAVAVVGSYAIRRFTRALGAVGQHPTHSAAIPIFGTCLLVALTARLQSELEWRLCLPAVAVAAVLLATGLRSRGIRSHYVIAAAVLFMFSALPLFGVAFSSLDATFDAAIGVVLLITGLGDHRLLRETLHQPTKRLA
jgi:hypothetical protein